MADENGDVKQASLEDSNMSNYGGKEMRDLRKGAAASDPNFKGAGQKVGLEVWRVENRRTEKDTPDFGVRRWPKEDYGQFYTGDSYLVLNTYKDKESDKLLWDVHFWLGKESSQDEIGVAGASYSLPRLWCPGLTPPPSSFDNNKAHTHTKPAYKGTYITANRQTTHSRRTT